MVSTTIAKRNHLKVGSTFTTYRAVFTVKAIFYSDTSNGNDTVIVPLATEQRLTHHDHDVNSAVATADSLTHLSAVTGEISIALGLRRTSRATSPRPTRRLRRSTASKASRCTAFDRGPDLQCARRSRRPFRRRARRKLDHVQPDREQQQLQLVDKLIRHAESGVHTPLPPARDGQCGRHPLRSGGHPSDRRFRERGRVVPRRQNPTGRGPEKRVTLVRVLSQCRRRLSPPAHRACGGVRRRSPPKSAPPRSPRRRSGGSNRMAPAALA